MSKRYAVLVVPCMLAPGLQAEYDSTKKHWGNLFLELLMRYHIDILPLPCVESSFGKYEVGLKRKKHGIDYYTQLEGYCMYCEEVACATTKQICDMIRGGYQFVAIVGVEHSPNCAVNYLYSSKGTIRRAGIYMKELRKKLQEQGVTIPYIGINRKYPRKALELLEKYIIQ